MCLVLRRVLMVGGSLPTAADCARLNNGDDGEFLRGLECVSERMGAERVRSRYSTLG